MGIITGIYLYSRPWKQGLILSPLYMLPADRKTIALTFDDGPSKERTPRLLRLLKAHEVKATFFMTGYNIERYPNIAKQVVREGHLVGNHSFHHKRMIFKSPGYIAREIDDTDTLIHSIGQTNVQFFRPPYSKKMLILPLLLKIRGKTLATGTYDPPAEYASPYNSTNIANEVTSNCVPGSIIYLHDGSDTNVDSFIDSIDQIILGVKAKGYTFVRLDG